MGWKSFIIFVHRLEEPLLIISKDQSSKLVIQLKLSFYLDFNIWKSISPNLHPSSDNSFPLTTLKYCSFHYLVQFLKWEKNLQCVRYGDGQWGLVLFSFPSHCLSWNSHEKLSIWPALHSRLFANRDATEWWLILPII